MRSKMTPAPWGIHESSIKSWIYGVNGRDDGGDIICDEPSAEISAKHWKGNSDAIIKAVNGTYGQGIAPESVKQMYEALHDCEDKLPLSDTLRALADTVHAHGESSWYIFLLKQADLIDAALKKAKI